MNHGMAKGQLGQGKGVRPVVTVGGGPAARHVCARPLAVSRFIFPSGMRERVGDKVCSVRARRERAEPYR